MFDTLSSSIFGLINLFSIVILSGERPDSYAYLFVAYDNTNVILKLHLITELLSILFSVSII